jgi:phage terminase large subunit-like protein
VVLKSDWNDNVKPTKEDNQQKIDGVISMIEALGGYLTETHYDIGI